MLPDCPAHACLRSDHTECWRDYNRQEDATNDRPIRGDF